MTATTVVVEAGFHGRHHCPVQATLPAAAAETALRGAGEAAGARGSEAAAAGQQPRQAPYDAQQRPPGDPELIARGQGLYGIHCRGCHGVDLRGGDLGGPNLLRSQLVLRDREGELIWPVVRDGQSTPGGSEMPPQSLSEADSRAVAEYVHSNARMGCRTLFATHYHELTELADHLPRARNYNVAVSEERGEVIFLRRIVPGGADRSYGVHVARLAGLPGSVVSRAWEVLRDLENGSAPVHGRGGSRRRRTPPTEQLPLFQEPPAALKELEGLDIASMTPLEAINKLYELQEKAREGQVEEPTS